VGDPVTVRIASLNRSFPGRVSRFSVDVEADTRTMHTEVDVPNPNRLLMPGMYAEATLTLNRRDRTVAVPREAVITEGGTNTAWVVDASGRVEARNVELGIETPGDVEVISGLREGDLVAIGDRSGLVDGEIVRPKEVRLIRYSGD